jgi:hypothetical protein
VRDRLVVRKGTGEISDEECMTHVLVRKCPRVIQNILIDYDDQRFEARLVERVSGSVPLTWVSQSLQD